MSVAAQLAPLAITAADVAAAAERLDGISVRTPLLSSKALDDVAGTRVFVKAEPLQRTGSFKFRGAYNRIAMIPATERGRGVVACSSGNHAQGVAEAARLFGVPASIVMPHDAPALKRARTERSGARVVGFDRLTEDRVALAMGIAEETGATFIHPFEDPGVMAGQGTIGLEIAEQLPSDLAAPRVLVCAGGGGLMAGIVTALAPLMPDAVMQPVEPDRFEDVTRSLILGERTGNTVKSGSIADAILTDMPGANTFPILKRYASPGYAVSDTEILRAMAFALVELKLCIEPGGAVCLAAVLAGKVPADRPIVLTASGGNADPAMIGRAVAPL